MFKLLRTKQNLALKLLKVILLIIKWEPEYHQRNMLYPVNTPNHTGLNLLVKALASSLSSSLSTKSVMDQNVVSMNNTKLHLQNPWL